MDRCFAVLGKISHKTESESATMGQLLTGVVCLLFLRTFVRVAADHNDSRAVYRCLVSLQCKENLHRTQRKAGDCSCCNYIFAGSLESAYSLNWGAREIWGQDLGTFMISRPI